MHSIAILALPLRATLDIPELTLAQLDRLLLTGLEIGADQLNLDRDCGIEEDGDIGGFPVATQTEGLELRVEDRRPGPSQQHAILGKYSFRSPFRKNINDLATHDQRRVLQNAGQLDVVLRDRYLSVIEDLEEPDNPRLPRELHATSQ